MDKPVLKLNLGCGPVTPAGWINIDGSNRAILASKLWLIDKLLVRLGFLPPTEFGRHVRICNLFKPLPFADNSVKHIYAGELWEHFELEDGERLTKECYRVLKPGGVLRICVPDGESFWRKYLELLDQFKQLPEAERQSPKQVQHHVQMYFRDICTRKTTLGSMGHFHKWQYDEIQLINQFESCGFTNVERSQYRKSRIDDVHLVERSDFLIIEGVKE